MTHFLGIDPGSHTCGWALVALEDDGRIEYVQSGEFTNHSHDLYKRVNYIFKGLNDIFSLSVASLPPGSKPELIMAYEMPYNRNFGTQQIWAVIGAVMAIDFYKVIPMHVRTIHAAWNRPGKMNRADGKEAAVAAANEAFGLTLGKDRSDEADAIWVAVAAAKRYYEKGDQA